MVLSRKFASRVEFEFLKCESSRVKLGTESCEPSRANSKSASLSQVLEFCRNIFRETPFFEQQKMIMIDFFRVYGKARYSQIRRYSQIQNGLARAVFYFEGGITVLASTVNRTRKGGFLYTLAYKEGGNRAS